MERRIPSYSSSTQVIVVASGCTVSSKELLGNIMNIRAHCPVSFTVLHHLGNAFTETSLLLYYA